MLIILQPLVVGAWCTLCLVTAVAMLVMIAPALDEVIAMLQFLGHARREGKPMWRTFWLGGTLESYPTVEGPRESPSHRGSLAARIVATLDLNNVPWNLLASAALGVWLMFVPSALGVTGRAADSDHLAGALVVTWAVIAFGEIGRPVRFVNVLMGLWLVAAPWLLAGDTAASRWNDVIVGGALIVLSLRRGRIDERFGGWNRYLV